MKIEIDTEKELSRIYDEMHNWSKLNKAFQGTIPKREVSKREAILVLRQILYNIEESVQNSNINEEYFNLARYFLTKTALI